MVGEKWDNDTVRLGYGEMGAGWYRPFVFTIVVYVNLSVWLLLGLGLGLGLL